MIFQNTGYHLVKPETSAQRELKWFKFVPDGHRRTSQNQKTDHFRTTRRQIPFLSVSPFSTSGNVSRSALLHTDRATCNCDEHLPPPGNIKVVKGGSSESNSSIRASRAKTLSSLNSTNLHRIYVYFNNLFKVNSVGNRQFKTKSMKSDQTKKYRDRKSGPKITHLFDRWIFFSVITE